MSKVLDKLKADVVKRFGPGAAAVIEYLYDYGTIHDGCVRNHMIKVDTFEKSLVEKRKTFHIHIDVADMYSVSPTYVYVLTNPKT